MGGESSTVLRLRLMRRLAMSHILSMTGFVLNVTGFNVTRLDLNQTRFNKNITGFFLNMPRLVLNPNVFFTSMKCTAGVHPFL